MTSLAVNVTRDMLINANDRPAHWGIRHRKAQLLRGLGWAAARGAQVTPHIRCTLVVTITYPPLARRRDASNLAPTIKHLLDGCIDGGILPDDDDKRIVATTYQASGERGETGVWRFQLEFTEAAA